MLAYRFKGRRFDCGSAEGYVEATNFCFENIYMAARDVPAVRELTREKIAVVAG
ncbi:hypothetical protein D9M70_594050 [compost metagenome]